MTPAYNDTNTDKLEAIKLATELNSNMDDIRTYLSSVDSDLEAGDRDFDKAAILFSKITSLAKKCRENCRDIETAIDKAEEFEDSLLSDNNNKRK